MRHGDGRAVVERSGTIKVGKARYALTPVGHEAATVWYDERQLAIDTAAESAEGDRDWEVVDRDGPDGGPVCIFSTNPLASGLL